MSERSRSAAALTALTAIGAAGLAWQIQPPLTELPRSLSLPVTPVGLAEFAYLLGWAGLVVLLAVVTARAVHRLTSVPPGTEQSTAWLLSQRNHARARPAPLALTAWNNSGASLVIGARAEAEVETPEHPSDTDANEPQPSPSVATDASEGRAHISVLGPLTVTGGRTSRRGLRTSALELIAYLALHPQGGSRDELLEAFWADEDPAKSRGRLYQATRDARRLLGDAAITTGHERYELDRRLVDVDLDELKALLAAADSGPEEGGRAELRERALALFRERPLSGSDYCWAEAELRRLRSLQIDLLAEVGQARLGRGDARGALDLAERGMHLDLLNEVFWRLAFEAEAALGMRAAIDDRYLKLKRILNERLGLQPAQETRTLYRRLLGQE